MSNSQRTNPALPLGEAVDTALVLDIYEKFLNKRKNAILGVVASAALLARN